MPLLLKILLPPAFWGNGEGNVFTGVCLSVHRGYPWSMVHGLWSLVLSGRYSLVSGPFQGLLPGLWSFLGGYPLVLSLVLSKVLFQVLPLGRYPSQDIQAPHPRERGTPQQKRNGLLRSGRLLLAVSRRKTSLFKTLSPTEISFGIVSFFSIFRFIFHSYEKQTTNVCPSYVSTFNR